jgi:hypothetical protein
MITWTPMWMRDREKSGMRTPMGLSSIVYVSEVTRRIMINHIPRREQTKVKTSTLYCQDKEKSIKHFVNPKMSPAADMRKVGTDGDGAHLDQMN